ncbi:MAG: hypothetical protein NZ900_06495, partial [Synergistetes bacterium]|nr:hypothetical protein [Synergistota bacterium]MDW8192574.1 hypothetical protein [Synergistota bacterium]
SPMAEAMLKRMLSSDSIEVKSAGLSAIDGMEASRWAQEVMRERGIDISLHRARSLTEKDVNEADLILTMSLTQKRELLERFPQAKGKTFLLSEFVFPEISRDIAEYERALDALEREKERLLSFEKDRLEILKRRYEELKREMNDIEREMSIILARVEDQLSSKIFQLRKLGEKLESYEIPDPYGKGKETYEIVARKLEELLTLLSRRLKEERF